MPYCRRCGAKLEDQDRFCPKCGTPAERFTASQTPPPQNPSYKPVPIKKDPLIIGGITLIAILVVAVVAVALLAAPVGTWNVNQSLTDKTPNVHTLNLNFDTDAGRVSVVALRVADCNLGIYIVGNGSRGALGGGNNPVSVMLENTTVGDALNVNVKVNVETRTSMSTNLGIRIFVDPALALNLNVTSHAGEVSFATDKATTLQSLALTTNAGTVDATIQNVTIAGAVSLNTNAGTINYRMSNVNVVGNCTLDLHSNAGTVNTDITQTKAMGGNLAVTAKTNLGSVDLNLAIDGDVGAKITSQTSLGSIHVNNANNFSGDRSPLQSNNYPATSNFDVDCQTNLGSVNINASYLDNQSTSTIRN
jgi:hypothetical protein